MPVRRIKKWLSQFFVRKPKSVKRKTPGGFQPLLEPLEDRLAPATLTVNTTQDVVNPSNGTLSLRDAISAIDAGNSNGLTTAELSQVSGTYGVNDTIQFALPSGSAINLTSALPNIGNGNSTRSIQIVGPGVAALTINGGGSGSAFSVFEVVFNTTATIENLTISNGDAYGGAGAGGGIYNEGGTLTVSNCILSDNLAFSGGAAIYNGATLTLLNSTLSSNTAANGGGGGIGNNATMTISNCTLSGNSDTNGFGGGINNYGTLTVNNSTLSGNTSGDGGGGIRNEGSLTVSNSTLSGNSASNTGNTGGGGIYNQGTLTLSNSTLSGNSSTHNGGAILNDTSGTLTLSNCTLSGNSANTFSGGIYNAGSTLTMVNTIVASNTATVARDLDGSATGNFNFIGNSQGSTLTGTGNITNEPADLSTLGNYGGPTQTIEPLSGSPAIGTGGAVTTISQSAGSTNTTIDVANAALIARTPGQYYIRVDGEEMEVTNVNITTNALTVVRAINGVSASTISSGDSVYFFYDQRGITRLTANDDMGAVTIRPVITAVQINQDISALYNAAGQPAAGVQRSMVNDVVYTFSGPVNVLSPSVDPNVFTIAVAAGMTGTVPTLSWAAVAGSNNTQWAVTFSGNGVTGGSIANGAYTITVSDPSSITAVADNQALSLFASGIGSATQSFYRLYGDINGDEVVNNADNAQFKIALTTYNAAFDYNADGAVNNADNVRFKQSLSLSFSGFTTTI